MLQRNEFTSFLPYMKLYFSEPWLPCLCRLALLCHIKFIMAHSEVFNGFHRSHRRGIALYYPMNWPKRLQIPSNRFSTQTVWTNSSIRKAGMCLGASHERLSVLEEVCGQPAWRKNSMWWVNLWCHTVDLCVREAVRPLCHLPNLSTSTVHWLCHWFNVMSVVHLVTGTHTL